MITEELKRIAKEGDMFAAEHSFKERMIKFDNKRAATLCQLAGKAASPTPDLLVMKILVGELRTN